MSKIVSIVGIVLIVAAGVLAAVSTKQEDVIKAKKTLCAKYIANAEDALTAKDFSKAKKFATLAIKADPENSSAYALVTKIAQAQSGGSTQTTQAPATTAQPAKKAAPAADDASLGC